MSALAGAAAAIGGGFLASLGQLAASPWMAVLAGASILVAAGYLCLRRTLAALPPAAPCPCCEDWPMEPADCTPRKDCSISVDDEIEQWLKEGGQHG